MTRISDERLADLIHDAEHEYWGGGDDVATALRELQALRKANQPANQLTQHAVSGYQSCYTCGEPKSPWDLLHACRPRS